MMSAPAGGDAAMSMRSLSCIVGIVLIAGCAGDVADPTAQTSEVEGRWITVTVANATDTDSNLAVVDEGDLTRVVGAAQPSTIAGHTTEQLRLFVPDDSSWVVTSNGVGGLYAQMVDGWCGDLPVTINLAEGIVDAAVPAFVHSGPGNCLGPVPPIRMTLYMRDQSVMGIGWKVSSGLGVAAQGIVSEQPTAQCFIVPYDWVLDFWVAEDFMDREDRHAGNFLTTAGDVPPAPDLALAIDIQVTSLPDVSWDGIPDWWRGPEPHCP